MSASQAQMFSVLFIYLFFNALISFSVFSSRFDWLICNRFYFMVGSQFPLHAIKSKKAKHCSSCALAADARDLWKTQRKSNMTFSMWVFELDDN